MQPQFFFFRYSSAHCIYFKQDYSKPLPAYICPNSYSQLQLLFFLQQLVVMLPNAQNDHQLMTEHAYYDRSDASSSIVSAKYYGPLLLGGLVIAVLLAKVAPALIRKRATKPSPKTMADQLV